MAKVAVSDIVDDNKELSFSFTNTKRGENISVNGGGCTMDLMGDLWGSPSGSISVIGGSTQHVFAKKDERDDEFFITDYQKQAINILIYNLAMMYPHEAKIGDGNSEDLNMLASSALENYRS